MRTRRSLLALLGSAALLPVGLATGGAALALDPPRGEHGADMDLLEFLGSEDDDAELKDYLAKSDELPTPPKGAKATDGSAKK